MSGNNEQGQRASIRQVALDMQLNIVMASRPELEVLKEVGIIGKRAPCAGLLEFSDAIRFIRGFGYGHVADALITRSLCIPHLYIDENDPFGAQAVVLLNVPEVVNASQRFHAEYPSYPIPPLVDPQRQCKAQIEALEAGMHLEVAATDHMKADDARISLGEDSRHDSGSLSEIGNTTTISTQTSEVKINGLNSNAVGGEASGTATSRIISPSASSASTGTAPSPLHAILGMGMGANSVGSSEKQFSTLFEQSQSVKEHDDCNPMDIEVFFLKPSAIQRYVEA